MMGRAESLIRPPCLKEGDRVRVVAPSGVVNRDRCEAGISLLERWGLVVERGRHLYGGYNIFSGSDGERLSDLQEALDDTGVKAIFCARGGYGLSRIVDRIDYRIFMDNPCWIVGYSDITALHIWVNGFLGVASVHGEMIAGICDSSKEEASASSLRDMLFEGGSTVEWESGQYADGVAEGILSGGNLSLISNLAGATGVGLFRNRILFIEETGEFLYRFDRMIEGLRLAGISSAVAGLLAGSFSDMEDTEISFGRDANAIVKDSFGEQGYAVATSFPAGHSDDNRALMLGAFVRLTVSGGRCRLEYLD
ncbi:MAG: LD-carboxypeptidase [Bacteroidales bacterium]